MLVKVRNPFFFSELFEQQKEDNVVGKNNDLTRFGFLHQPLRDAVAPSVVEGRHGIIKYDAGGIISGAKFRKECRYGQAPLLGLRSPPSVVQHRAHA